MKKRMRYGVGTGIMAVALAVGSMAWACTPPNGVTVVDNCVTAPGSTLCEYTRGSLVMGHAESTFAQGSSYDTNWKLFIGEYGKWCMWEYTLHALSGPHTRVDPNPRVPTTGSASGVIPTTWPLGNADVCMNNGDGGGNTANPRAVTVLRKLSQ